MTNRTAENSLYRREPLGGRASAPASRCFQGSPGAAPHRIRVAVLPRWEFGRLALVFMLSLLPCFAREAGRGAPRRWENALVSLEVTRKQYDFLQPWSRRAQTVFKAGLVVGPSEILTTATDFSDRTVVRVQKGGRGQWSNAEVKWVDYPANLALITTTDSSFWNGLKSVALAEDIARDGAIQIVRWRAGNLEVRKAEFNRFNVNNPNAGEAAHVLLELNSEIDGAGWAEPALADQKVIGLVFAQTGNMCQVLPSPFIRSILDAQRKGLYRGLGYFDFTWQPTQNPETLRYLKLRDAGRGVVVIHVPVKSAAPPVLKPRDVLLQVDGFDVDNEGDYVDPLYGHLLLENLSTRNKWAGDQVRLKIWRDGQAMDVGYTLPRIQDAARLVPESSYDQAPEYLIVGGLVFQPLTRNYLRSWGQDWERNAPFRLAYFRNEEPTAERPAVVILSSVLPDIFNLGYQDVRNLVVEKVNGQRASYLAQLDRALKESTNGFHTFEFLAGETLQRIVLDAGQMETATRRVLERYGIEKDRVILAEPKP